jgi:hypothetical protein
MSGKGGVVVEDDVVNRRMTANSDSLARQRMHHIIQTVMMDVVVNVQMSDSPLPRSIFYTRGTPTIVQPLPATAHLTPTTMWQRQHANLDDVW